MPHALVPARDAASPKPPGPRKLQVQLPKQRRHPRSGTWRLVWPVTAGSTIRGLEAGLSGDRWAPAGMCTREPSARTERTQTRLVRPFLALHEQAA